MFTIKPWFYSERREVATHRRSVPACQDHQSVERPGYGRVHVSALRALHVTRHLGIRGRSFAFFRLVRQPFFERRKLLRLSYALASDSGCQSAIWNLFRAITRSRSNSSYKLQKSNFEIESHPHVAVKYLIFNSSLFDLIIFRSFSFRSVATSFYLIFHRPVLYSYLDSIKLYLHLSYDLFFVLFTVFLFYNLFFLRSFDRLVFTTAIAVRVFTFCVCIFHSCFLK